MSANATQQEQSKNHGGPESAWGAYQAEIAAAASAAAIAAARDRISCAQAKVFSTAQKLVACKRELKDAEEHLHRLLRESGGGNNADGALLGGCVGYPAVCVPVREKNNLTSVGEGESQNERNENDERDGDRQSDDGVKERNDSGDAISDQDVGDDAGYQVDENERNVHEQKNEHACTTQSTLHEDAAAAGHTKLIMDLPPHATPKLPATLAPRMKRAREGKHNGETPPPKRYSPRICSTEGCTSQAQRGGVCIRHGARVKKCSVEGCTNNARKGGVCTRHGATRKKCGHDGCANLAGRGGFCRRHGGRFTVCSAEGCGNAARKGGVCRRHGGMDGKVCAHEGCTTISYMGGVCRRHGGSNFLQTKCTHMGCNNQAQKDGVCKRHGARLKTCRVEGCFVFVKRNGLCHKHGAMLDS